MNPTTNPPSVKPAGKWFQCSVLESQLEYAISLPGWSHCGPERKRAVSWYPFEAPERVIYFRADNRTKAAKQLIRCGCSSVKDLVEYQSETPARIVKQKCELARRICMDETHRGYFGRLAMFQSIWNIGGAK